MNNDDLLLDVLRAAGHGDAAELASKVLAHGQAAKPAETVAPVAPARQCATFFGNNDDAARREGEAILDRMREMGIAAAGPKRTAPEGEAA